MKTTIISIFIFLLFPQWAIAQSDSLFWNKVYEGDLEAVTDFMKKPENVNRTDEAGWTPLFYAARSGNVKMVVLLLDKKASLEPSSNWTPLMLAVSNNYLAICKLLYQAGANLNHKNSNDQTALEIAQNYGFEDIIAFLENPERYLETEKNADAPTLKVGSKLIYECVQGKESFLISVQVQSLAPSPTLLWQTGKPHNRAGICTISAEAFLNADHVAQNAVLFEKDVLLIWKTAFMLSKYVFSSLKNGKIVALVLSDFREAEDFKATEKKILRLEVNGQQIFVPIWAITASKESMLVLDNDQMPLLIRYQTQEIKLTLKSIVE